MADTVQNGKGSKRRKEADDVSFAEQYDKIDWSTLKKPQADEVIDDDHDYDEKQ